MDSDQIISMKIRRERRPYNEQFKAQVIHACNHPGALIAAIAQAYDININVLRRWRCEVSVCPTHLDHKLVMSVPWRANRDPQAV